MKVETCAFSGWKIYPGHGILLIRNDSKSFRFRTSKDESYFLQRQKNAKFRWTAVYRRLHKKGSAEALARRKRRVVKKTQRAVVGMDMALVNKIKKESTDERQKRRDAALKELRERRAKAKSAAKKNPQAGGAQKGATSSQKVSKSAPVKGSSAKGR
jgi:large subunit ribosomal protein L24e